MLTNENTDIDNLLAKHFAKESLSIDEKEQLTKWIDENSEEYTHLVKLINHKEKSFNVDTDKAWEKVLAKKERSTNKSKILPFIPKTFFKYGMVASFLILLGVMSWIYLSKSPYEEYYNSNLFAETVTLPDNSTVTLNQNTRLRYYNKTKNNRRTELLTGEAFFEVQPNKDKPFIIATGNAKIQVLGTSFNVKTNNKNTEVSVKTGTVSLTNKKESKSVILTRGEQGTAKDDDIIKTKLKTANYLSWKNKKLVFKDISLFDATKDLENFYQIKIEIPETCKNCIFTTTFTNETIEEAMKEIQILTHIQYKIKGNQVIVYCENCN